MKAIFHITSRAEAAEAIRLAQYVPVNFDAEGFIHCSYAQQVAPVADRFFPGRSDLVLFQIEPTALSCEVVEENLEGGTELFPHIYGKLPMSAVVRVHDFPCRADGRFDLPADVNP